MKPRHYKILAETSRTFLLPIAQAPSRLQDAIGSAYLCMRAIDEIEDHPTLSSKAKINLLLGIAKGLKGAAEGAPIATIDPCIALQAHRLPEVCRRLSELALIADPEVRPLIWRYTADMARSMAGWVETDWQIENEADLDQYTFDVAGRVGLLLSRLWQWYDGTITDDTLAIGFGRALQAVNIVRNREEDRQRGVDFFPTGWEQKTMIAYTHRQLTLADGYMAQLSPGAVRDFCRIPLELARATLEAIEAGRDKLSRKEVMSLMARLATDKSKEE